jgi:hypothetical protein
MGTLWARAVVGPVEEFGQMVARILPNVLAMLFLIAVGFIVGWLVRKVLARTLAAFGVNRLAARTGITELLARGEVRATPSDVMATTAYWLVVLSFAMAGLMALDTRPTTDFVSAVFVFLPRLLAAVLILVVGALAGNVAAQATLVAAVNSRIEGAGLLARGVRLAVTIVAGAMALSQLGLAIEIVVATFSILFGGVVLALALAFGIGGRDLAKQFLERWVAQGQSRRREAGRGGERQISHL